MRRLEDICAEHGAPPPRQTIRLYYALCYLLSNGNFNFNKTRGVQMPEEAKKRHEFYLECVKSQR
ncbi:MAG: hypothetical protein PHC61_00865 [Chitinivibrionales bacterium]|nr:hypothetical protein [Chitinivibrionales bacterium]